MSRTPQDATPEGASLELTSGKPITTATVLSPNQWEFLQQERFRRGKGWNTSRLIREAIEAHFGQAARDDVGAPGGGYRDGERRTREA